MCNDAMLHTISSIKHTCKKITYIGQMGVKKTHFLKVQVKFTWGGWNQAHFECVSVNNTSTEEVM